MFLFGLFFGLFLYCEGRCILAIKDILQIVGTSWIEIYHLEYHSPYKTKRQSKPPNPTRPNPKPCANTMVNGLKVLSRPRHKIRIRIPNQPIPRPFREKAIQILIDLAHLSPLLLLVLLLEDSRGYHGRRGVFYSG